MKNYLKISYIIIVLLFICWELNAQMALPTFQGVQAISSVTDLAGIFGDATSFTYMANNRWTHTSSAVTGWGNISQNRNHFISYINLTTSSETGYINTQESTNGNGITGISATQTGGYTVSEAIVYSSTNQGIWMSSYTNTSVVTATMSGGWGTNRGIQIRSWSGGYHKCVLVKVTANSKTRYFAPKNITKSSSAFGGYVFYPLNDTFTSFTDSRLTSLGNSDAVLPDSYFEYAP